MLLYLCKEIKYSYVKKCSLTGRPEIECTSIERGFFTFVCFRVEDIHYWRPEELVPFSYQIILYTIALKLYLALRCVLTWWNHSFLQDRALFISNVAAELQWDGIPSSCQSYLILMASQNSCFVSWVSSLVNSKPLFD